jgi:hypothetical protein
LIHTFHCGLYQLDGIATAQPTAKHLKTFEGDICAVPLLLGHYWVQTLSTVHAVASYDVSDLAHIREVSRITFDDKQGPHWISAEPGNRRIIVNSGEYADHRLFMINFDPDTGALTLDKSFRDPAVTNPASAWMASPGRRLQGMPIHTAQFSRAGAGPRSLRPDTKRQLGKSRPTKVLKENLGGRRGLDRMISRGETIKHQIVMRDDLGSC